MKITKILFSALLILFFISCEKDDSPNIPQNQGQDHDAAAFAENFGNEISRNFLGTVVDINNNPIENVMISIGSSTAMTDSNGVFIINNATVNQRFGYVKAEKAGYIHASRAVVPSSGTNKVRIMMLAETVAGTTSSGTQETISLSNGSKVALEGDYIKPDGTNYDGNVNVIMHLLDPVDDNMQDQMPGMLYAANAQNEERMLQTFGMLAVELRGDNGEDLNLAEGSTAEITVPLDPSLVATAPSTIPLWYFDEVNGYWIEDGEATLVGNQYVGTVSHFSFWNCDIPAEVVNLCTTVTDSNGNLIVNSKVTLTSTNFGTTYGYTNQNGEVCGVVPSSETLELKVLSYVVCGETPISSENVGPFNEDSSISITIADNPEIITETVIGTFIDCSGISVTDGYVQLQYGNQIFTDVVNNGDFEIDMIRCDSNDTFSIKAYDVVNAQQTDSLNYAFSTPLTNLGALQSCDTIGEFITYQVEEYPDIIITNNITTELNPFGVYYQNFSPGQDIFITFYMIPNTGQLMDGVLYNNNNSNISFYFGDEYVFHNNTSDLNFVIQGYEANSEYIDIQFNGTINYTGQGGQTMSGFMHVLRPN